MRITNLQLKDKEYKNLDIDLNGNTSGVMAFIGNNGSGKSNLLESLCIIFYFLYHRKEKEIPFNFSISYTTSGSIIPIKITKSKTTVICYSGDKKISDPYTSLPKQIVAIYSGEENRLWKKWFEPIYFEYINNITSGKTTGIGAYNDMPKMLFINKFYWHISLLCLLLQRSYNKADDFCKEILNIKEVHSIKFKFNRSNYSKYPASSIKSFIQLIDPKDEYTLAELNQIIEKSGYIISEIYKFLYIAFTPDKNKILESITIKYNDENLEVEDFSEGEKKLLLIKAALEFAGAEDSLFILDEPDAHVHLNNKVQIKKVLEKYADHRQIILTTHSPTLTDSLTDDALFMLNSGKLVPEKKQKILENVSGDFWNKMQQNSFISSKKPIILLVEGKHDKEHITNAFEALKDDYLTLDFQCFVLNGETKLQPFLSGLYESDFHTDKLYIGIYDNDNAGNQSYGKGFTTVTDNFKKLLESNNKENNSYFAIKLPKPEGITCDCTIETLYELNKFEDAISTATNNALGHLQNKSIDDIAKGIKEQAKNVLSENSKTFTKDDFKNFKSLFDLISEIHTHRKGLLIKTMKSEPIIDKAEPRPKAADFIEVYSKRRGTDLTALFYSDTKKTVLQPGSIIASEVTTSYTAKSERIKLKKKYCEFTNNKWVVKTPMEFSSPSGAIKFAVGSNINGWKYWLIEGTGAILETIRNK